MIVQGEALGNLVQTAFSAPKGRAMIAQGAALGNMVQTTFSAPKGNAVKDLDGQFFQAFA
jgi:hypothetical protein